MNMEMMIVMVILMLSVRVVELHEYDADGKGDDYGDDGGGDDDDDDDDDE